MSNKSQPIQSAELAEMRRLAAEARAVFDLMLTGCALQEFGDYQNGNGETIGPRMDALHSAMRAYSATHAQPIALSIEVIDHCWKMYQQGQISADHTNKEVFAETLQSLANWLGGKSVSQPIADVSAPTERKLLNAAKAFAKEHIEGDALHDDESTPDDAVKQSDERYNETKRLLCDAYLELQAAPAADVSAPTATTVAVPSEQVRIDAARWRYVRDTDTLENYVWEALEGVGLAESGVLDSVAYAAGMDAAVDRAIAQVAHDKRMK